MMLSSSPTPALCHTTPGALPALGVSFFVVHKIRLSSTASPRKRDARTPAKNRFNPQHESPPRLCHGAPLVQRPASPSGISTGVGVYDRAKLLRVMI